MEILQQSIIQINLVDDEVLIFKNAMDKIKKEAVKPGFKKILNKDEIALLTEINNKLTNNDN